MNWPFNAYLNNGAFVCALKFKIVRDFQIIMSWFSLYKGSGKKGSIRRFYKGHQEFWSAKRKKGGTKMDKKQHNPSWLWWLRRALRVYSIGELDTSLDFSLPIITTVSLHYFIPAHVFLHYHTKVFYKIFWTRSWDTLYICRLLLRC